MLVVFITATEEGVKTLNVELDSAEIPSMLT